MGEHVSKSLRVTCDTKLTVALDDLHGIQGAMKEMTEERYQKFRRLIIRDGINFSMHVWREPLEKKKFRWWIIDGHGRHALLVKMRAEGYVVPPIPCVEIEASSFRDAKRRVLAASSSFHRATPQGVYEFLSDIEMPLEEIADYDLPDIDVPEFLAEFADVAPTDMPTLSDEGKPPFQQMTFTLHDEQVAQVKAALERAKAQGSFDSPNENANGNALARVCETFLTRGAGA